MSDTTTAPACDYTDRVSESTRGRIYDPATVTPRCLLAEMNTCDDLEIARLVLDEPADGPNRAARLEVALWMLLDRAGGLAAEVEEAEDANPAGVVFIPGSPLGWM